MAVAWSRGETASGPIRIPLGAGAAFSTSGGSGDADEFPGGSVRLGQESEEVGGGVG